MFVLEDHIPLRPSSKPTQNSQFSEFLGKVQVGQSFLVERPKKGSPAIYQSALYYGKKSGKKFVGRNEGEKLRIYRIQ